MHTDSEFIKNLHKLAGDRICLGSASHIILYTNEPAKNSFEEEKKNNQITIQFTKGCINHWLWFVILTHNYKLNHSVNFSEC